LNVLKIRIYVLKMKVKTRLLVVTPKLEFEPGAFRFEYNLY